MNEVNFSSAFKNIFHSLELYQVEIVHNLQLLREELKTETFMSSFPFLNNSLPSIIRIIFLNAYKIDGMSNPRWESIIECKLLYCAVVHFNGTSAPFFPSLNSNSSDGTTAHSLQTQTELSVCCWIIADASASEIVISFWFGILLKSDYYCSVSWW